MRVDVKALEGRIVLTYASPRVYGVLHLAQGEDGRWFVNTEGMHKAFAVEVLKAWLLNQVESVG